MWRGLAGGWGAPRETVDAAYADVCARYAEAHRRYHTLEHIREVLAALDQLGGAGPAVWVAAWLHDVVYDPHADAGANEAASADHAARLVTRLGGPPDVADDAARLVRSTESHSPDGPGAELLSDADLWILGAPRERYRRYASDVRDEYGFLGDDAWRSGRAAVLGSLQARPRIYRVASGWEAAARANLAWELATLGGGQPQA
jgi:predicted metal-dependent HD superfamily phosphohydrolase